ncbi:MAG TPA: hypothetical protein VJU61_07275 [Polyangiaceae bacterium]|nr:hypothetical protein [Polyangiaceae bacterium]
MLLPFNRVTVRPGDGQPTSSLSVAEFSAMPLTTRLRAVLEQRVQFFRDEQPVDVTEALRALREAGPL